MTRRAIPIGFAFLLGAAVTILAGLARDDDAAADAAKRAVAEAALDYPMSYYEGDAARMERRLHPDLRKCIYTKNRQTGEWGLQEITAARLIELVEGQHGTKVPEEARRADVTVLDIYGNMASVKIAMHDWVDYLHLAKIDGEWKIVNVMWEHTPEIKEKYGLQ